MTTKRINSLTFSRDLEAAGLHGLPFSWGADGSFAFPMRRNEVDEEVLDDERMSSDQRAAVMAVYAAHDPDAPSFSRGAALLRARDARKPILDALAGVGFDALAIGDTSTVAAVRAARQGLLDITKQADVIAATLDDDFDAAVMAHYRSLAMAAPSVVRNAFRDLLA